MLTAGELQYIQDRVRGRFGVYLRLVHGPRFWDIVCVPDGITWLLQVTSSAGAGGAGALDGDTAEQQLCSIVYQLKKDLAERGAPS